MADAFVFSSGLAAAVGGSLSLAASLALGAPQIAVWVFLAASGTFLIYTLDRLRDRARDRSTSPIRTAFVSRHRQGLIGAAFAVAIGFTAVLFTAPSSIIQLCLTVGLIGAFHRRLKNHPAIKTIYVSLSWVAICVGIPWLASGHTPNSNLGVWVASVFLPILTANLIASNLRDDESLRLSGGHLAVLWTARGFAAMAIGIAFAAPDELFALVWIPACEALALIFFRRSERYRHVAIDGALLIGALATSIQLASTA
jgi:4-hydroxybenzoate polyprenyltransferase